MVCGGEVQSGASGLEGDQHDRRALFIGKFRNHGGSVPGGTIESDEFDVLFCEDRLSQVQQ